MATETQPQYQSPSEFQGSRLQALDPERRRTIQDHNEVVLSLDPEISDRLIFFTQVGKIWQPSKHLPDLKGPDGPDKLRVWRRRGMDMLSNGTIAVIVGHGITEGGIAPFETGYNRVEVFRDRTGTDQHSRAKVVRWWTGEEDRHKILYDRMIMLSGRVIMPEYERSVQSLIRNGVNPAELDEEVDPYEFIFYVAFQEQETYIATLKLAELAGREGSEIIEDANRDVASDENRHANLFGWLGGRIFDLDPEGAVIAFDRALSKKRGIVMPGALMTSGEDATGGATPLFRDLIQVESAMNGFTARDYANIFEGLIKKWRIDKIAFNTDAAQAAQANVMKLLAYHQRAAAIMGSSPRKKEIKLPWIEDPISLAQSRG